MVKLKKTLVTFSEPGPENTDDVLQAVVERIKAGDVKTVVVASTSGKTGLRFAEALKDQARVVVISHKKMEAELKEGIVRVGGVAIDETNTPLHEEGMDDVRNTLYTMSRGVKVAVEVILIAAEKKAIELFTDVIGVGGRRNGSDSAIVAKSTTAADMFSEDLSKNLEIREIIAMPLKKL